MFETVEQIEAEIAKLQRERIVMIAQTSSDDVWPKRKDEYFVLLGNGHITCDDWLSSDYDTDCMSLGNVFQSSSHAVQEREARRVVAELRMQPGCKAFAPKELNWFIQLTIDEEGECHLDVYCTSARPSVAMFSTFFETSEAAHNALMRVSAARLIQAQTWFSTYVTPAKVSYE